MTYPRSGSEPPARSGRHGRGFRGPLAWPPHHEAPSPAQRFDALLQDSVQELCRAHPQEMQRVQVIAHFLPSPEAVERALGRMPVASVYPGHRHRPHTVVVYRRPLETRAENERDLALLLHATVVEYVAEALNVHPSVLDPLFDED